MRSNTTLLDRAGERVRRLVLVVEIDDEPVVTAHVHPGIRGRQIGTVLSSRPSPICSPFAHSVTSPPLPGFCSSASNSIFTLTSPVGSGLVDVCR